MWACGPVPNSQHGGKSNGQIRQKRVNLLLQQPLAEQCVGCRD